MNSLNRLIDFLEKGNVFLTGGAGVGKSYLIKEVIKEYKKEYRGVVALGSTGISAVNVSGQTIHSFFSFGICSNLDELSANDRYNKNRIKELAKLLKNTDLIVIDEISMVSGNLLEMILYRLRQCGYNGRLLVVGDFYQLPPVQKKQTRSRTIFDQGVYAFESSAWEVFDFSVLELTKVKRTTDKEFMLILEKIRKAKLDEDVYEYLDALRKNSFSFENEATVLFGTNSEADRLNFQKIASINRPEVQLPSIVKQKDHSLDKRKIDNWKKNLPIVENLKLKEGIPVIFTTNKWGSYHNGERAFVVHIDKDSIVVEKNSRLVKVDRFSFDMSKAVLNAEGLVEEDTLCTLEQFPIRPAYAVTIHKSQGMSIENLICNVNNIFADSQFYVALSRATDPKRLKIEYAKEDLKEYLKRVLRVNESVISFYEKNRCVVID